MNEANLKKLNAIPLTDVMRAWGLVPQHMSKDGARAVFLCPWHNDHHPSLTVDLQLRDGAEDLGFKCWACGEEGFGAIQLAARLMGFPAGKVPDESVQEVLDELMSRCDVELEEEDGKNIHNNKRINVVGWDVFHKDEKQYADWDGEQPIFERGEWTEEGLKALGLKLELATHRAKSTDVSSFLDKPSGRADYKFQDSSNASTAAVIRIGDTVTEFNPDTGEALYRCSFGKDFYRGPKAETKTIKEWGEQVERIFGVEPVSRFVKRDTPKQGGAVAMVIKATKNYPMFIFRYPWGVKKYEPKSTYANTKWTWWCLAEDADLDHRWYADAALTDVLEGAIPTQDERHPFAVGDKDKDGNAVKVRFERVVLCSGPRDAIAVYSHSNAHVVWLHSEQSGFNSKGESLRPNRWLRALLRKLQNVTVEGGLYVCYDEDETGLMASQAIALNSPNIHWLRLPKELGLVSGFRFQVSGEAKVKPLKDVTDFVTRFAEVERLIPADLQHDDPTDWFDNALFDTPTTQFWQWESERKDADGTGRARYKFDLRNTPVFLRARGMVRTVMQQGKSSFSRFFLLGKDKTYTEIFPGEKGNNKLVAQTRDLMADWLRAHKEHNDEKGALSRAIFSAKLEQSVLESIELVDIDDKSFGEDFDHFFF